MLWTEQLKLRTLVLVFTVLGCFPVDCLATAQAIDREQELANQSVREALLNIQQGNYNEALKSFQRAAQEEPNNSFAYYGIALSLANLRRWNEAVEPLRRVFSLNPHPQWKNISEKMVRSLLAEIERNANNQRKRGDYAIPIEPVTIVVPEGEFIFRNLRITTEENLDPKLNGEVINNTTKDWSHVSFQIEALEASGNKIENGFDILNDIELYSFKKGENKSIDNKGLTGLENKPIANLSIKFREGEYNARYIFSMVKPRPSNDLTYKDALIEIMFVLSKQQIGFVLLNKTDNPIKIDWNLVSYIDIASGSHKVMHEGVKYINRTETQSPSVIPPTANLKDIIFPTDYVSYSSSRYSSGWTEEPLFPEGPRAAKYRGQSFSIFIPLEINGVVKNYLFTFKITDVEM